MIRLPRRAALGLALAALLATPGLGADFTPVTITHLLGETVITQRPEKVAALDMNELDFLDRLGVPVAGTAKDYVPHFLAKYRDDPAVADLGFIVKPNLEKVYALRPDLILMTSLQAEHYAEMSRLAPVVHYDVDYRNSSTGHMDVVRAHFRTLAGIFDKQAQAEDVLAGFDAKLAEVQQVTRDRPERALLVMHNNGSFSAFGTKSRYGFVFDALGVKPANAEGDSALHGQRITSEFIQATNPDIILIIDRTAVMERRPVPDAASIANPLLRETNAWKNGKLIFVDPEAWYTTAASITPLTIIMDEVIAAYRR